MATALTCNFVGAIEALTYSQNKSFADSVNFNTFAARQKLTAGTGVNQIDQVYQNVITLAGSGATAIDLVGVTNDPLNLNISMLTIVGIWIVNWDLNLIDGGASLTIGGGTNPISGLFGATSQQIKLPPGGFINMCCSRAGGLATCIAGTGDILNITNGAAATSTFQIVIVGRSV